MTEYYLDGLVDTGGRFDGIAAAMDCDNRPLLADITRLGVTSLHFLMTADPNADAHVAVRKMRAFDPKRK